MPAAIVATLPLGEVISITLPGAPIAKGRARSRIVYPRKGTPFISFYTPAETVSYERALARVGKTAMRARAPLDGALKVTVTAYMPAPPSWSGVKRAKAMAGEIRPSVKPDADNVLKTLDALNGIVWIDDAQIVDAQIIKTYSASPRLVIEITAL
jgi:Holliday junction resolvase RusA-like endonuclease